MALGAPEPWGRRGRAPQTGCPAPKPPPTPQVGVQDAPPAPASLPADCHVDLYHGGLLLLPHGQQVVQVGHQRVEEGHHEGQDQQDGFLLPLATAPRAVVLMNLVSGYRGERVAAGSPVTLGWELYQGCRCLPPWYPDTSWGNRWRGAALTVCMCSEK